mmetsp:Transcript_119090/g.167455  ORF Transcript_119090/g.167455 Transcript_119090/m.167455 type:complete len:305 (-) Transcript_119090:37-951(-)
MSQSWDPSIACTPERIRKEIANCENGILAAEHRGEKQVAREKKRLEEVLTTRAEMLANHEKALAKMSEEHDVSLAAMVRKAEHELNTSLSAQDAAISECKSMFEKAAEIEQRKAILEKEVKELYRSLDKLQKDFDQERVALIEAAENEVQRLFSSTTEQVRNASLFAQEVQTDAFAAIDRMQDEIKASAEVADSMAQSRSRFDALHQVASSRTVKGISEKHFTDEKSKILGQWWSSWEGHIGSLSPGPPSLAQIAASRPDTPMVPSQNRPRSVELARQRAEQQSRKAWNALPTVSQELRPKTAP